MRKIIIATGTVLGAAALAVWWTEKSIDRAVKSAWKM